MWARSNDSSVFHVYEQTIVTHGEWALKKIDAIRYNETKNGFSQSAIIYTVRKY